MTKNTKNIAHKKIQRFRFSISFGFAILLTAIMWVVKLFETSLHISLADYGVFPLTTSGLRGILFSPFIHGSLEHLFSNTFPFLILTTLLLYFYPKKGFKIFSLLYFCSGILLWIIGREAYHIGMSGIIYSLASFIFFAGILSKKREYIAIALIVIFLYGSLIWGMMPDNHSNTSWEAHLSGFLIGALFSLFFHHKPEIKLSSIDDTKNIYFYYIYDFKISDSSYNWNFFYTFIDENQTQNKYIINYETDCYVSCSNYYGYSNFGSTTIF